MWSRSASGLDLREGRQPVIVYAPHGGRRTRPLRRGDGVNDLHTAEIAREIADAVDAHAILNRTIDRNVADLNRISALSSTAAPALADLRRGAEKAGEGGAVPLVLLVHGWNVTMPACDIGIGLTRSRGGDGELRGGFPTVSRATYASFVASLIDALEAHGIEAPLGLRYPASGRDNATQLFSGRHREHSHADVATLSKLAAGGALDAVQLELAIPLRWPGAYRDRFLAALVDGVRRDVERRRASAAALQSARTEWSLAAARSRAGKPAHPRPLGWNLQAVLPDGSGLFGGAEPVGASAAAARLCLARSDGRLVLFVGEDAWSGDENGFRVGGLELTATLAAQAATRVRLTYDGPMVIYPSHDAFCDLETGLAASRLAAGTADVTFEARHGAFGSLRGFVVCAGERIEIDVTAVCERASRRSGATRGRSRVFVTHGTARPMALHARFDGAPPCEPRCECRIGSDGEVAEIDCVLEDGAAKKGRVLTRVPVYRVLTEELAVKVTFGTAAITEPQGEVSLALFEHVELLDMS